MQRTEITERLEQSGLVAIVRTPTPTLALDLARAMARAGVPVIEISMTVPGALEALRQLRAELGDSTLLGAGTALDAQAAQACIEAGAEFVLSPALDLRMVDAVHEAGKAAVPGALTPTEVITAWQGNADLVKVFPCSALGGPGYIRTLLAPVPQMKLLPVGGVTLQNAADYFAAGAVAVGVGSSLASPELLPSDGDPGLRARARAWAEVVAARASG